MGKRVKKVKSAKLEIYTSSKEDRRKRKSPIEAACSDDEANEDLSLKIVQKFIQRAVSNASKDVPEIVVNLKEEKSRKEKKKRKKSKEIEITGDAVDNIKDKEPEVDNAAEVSNKAAEISIEAVEANPVSVSDNVVLRKLLRGPRYFDPPDNNSWGTCYNCGEEGHTTVNCTSAKRKKPCFVCGSFEHNAKQCSKAHDCFICKQQGHRARDCPDRYNSLKMCLKCGDFGHDMFSCSNDYCPDDLKEIQCYICGRFGHLCCRNSEDPGPRDVRCYRCGLSGHTGLACLVSRGDTNDGAYASSCYRCGLVGHFARECTSSMNACLGSRGDTSDIAHGSSCYKCGLTGHFARECTTSSMKAGKRNHEPSTPKQRTSKKNRDRLEVKYAPHDYGKSQKKKKSWQSAFTSASKMKHKGGWITEDHGDYYCYSQSKANNWRSSSTPSNGRSKFSTPNSNYVLGSCSSKNHQNFNFNDSPSYVSTRYYQHRSPESRFGNSNGGSGVGRNYNRW